VSATVLAAGQRCRVCERRIAPDGRRPAGVILHSGRGLCWRCRTLSDDEVETIELARLFSRDPAVWMRRAACIKPGVNPEWFHPMDHDRETLTVARNVCRGCPVKHECLDDAIATRDAFGVRGGLTHTERARLAKERNG